MSNNLELVGQRALVTGGTKGIGKAVVGQLREAGAIVLTTARTSSGDLTDSNLFVAADITTAGGCEAVTQAVHDRLGGIDIMVHVVGGSSAPVGGFAVLDDDEWHRALDPKRRSHTRPRRLRSRPTARACRKRSARRASAWSGFRQGGSKRKPQLVSLRISHGRTAPTTKEPERS
jgi:NAD(P)-dependent dehydrogenase (short-subunit alcohol dehydrogenase family)